MNAPKEFFAAFVRSDNAELVVQIGLEAWLKLWAEDAREHGWTEAQLRSEALEMVREYASHLTERLVASEDEDLAAELVAAQRVMTSAGVTA